MFPLIAIAGAISAVASVAKGASWLSAHVGSSKTASAGGNAEVKSQTSAKASPFEAMLAAQAAGQTLPGNAAGASLAKGATQSAMVPPIHGTDYDTLARMKAGMAAYSHIGERHGNHAGAAGTSGSDDDKPVTRS
jgi:hypothetical protein